MKIRVAIGVALLSCANLACRSSNNGSPSVAGWTPLVPTTQISAYSDSSFVGRVSDTYFASGRWLLCETRVTQVVVLDEHSLDPIRTIGSKGEGPGEFSYCTRVYGKTDSVYVYDSSPRAISVFRIDGHHVREFPTQHLRYGFDMNEKGHVVSSVYFSDPPIGVVAQNGEYVNRFGSMLIDSGSDFQNAETSYRHVRVLDDGSLLSVGVSVPLIESFTGDGTLVSSTDLSDFPLIRSAVENAERISMEEAARTEPAPSRHTIVVKDVAVSGNDLLLLIWDVSGAEMVFNRLLRLPLNCIDDTNAIEYFELVDTSGVALQYAWTFAVNDEGSTLLAFDNTPETLFVYELN